MSQYIYLANIEAFSGAYSQADFFGKLIFLGLFFLSALCWTVLIQKIRLVKKVKRESAQIISLCDKHKERLLSLDPKDLPIQGVNPFIFLFINLKEKCIEVLNKNHFFISQNQGKEKTSVFLSEADLELLESHAITSISKQSKVLEKNVFILSTIVTLAPFVGLLGTVWGILMTFSGLHSGGTVGSNSAVLGGLSTALATTVLGLLIAIPALIAHSYLKNALRLLNSDMEDFSYAFLSTVELQYRKVEI